MHICQKIVFQSTKIGAAKISILGEFGNKIKILYTHNLLCWKITIFCPYVFTHDAACRLPKQLIANKKANNPQERSTRNIRNE